jgi:hypothetical protein
MSDENDTQSSANGQTFLPAERQTGRLNSLTSVRRELVATYRALKRGEIDRGMVGTRTYVLSTIAKILEVEQLDRRLKALEDRARSAGGGALESMRPLIEAGHG